MHKLILFLSIGLFLYGDVMYEMNTTTEGMLGMGATETTTSIYIKGDRRRKESTTKNPVTGEVSTITITRLDKKLTWTLYMDQQQYSETKLGEQMKLEEETEGKTEAKFPEIKVERTEKKKEILEKMCEEVIISMNVANDEDNLIITQTMWLTQDIVGYEEIQGFNKKFTEVSSDQILSSTMEMNTKSFEEFQKNIGEIEGFPLEMELNIQMGTEAMPFSMKSHSTVTKIETTPIHEKVFEIPEGFVLKE